MSRFGKAMRLVLALALVLAMVGAHSSAVHAASNKPKEIVNCQLTAFKWNPETRSTDLVKFDVNDIDTVQQYYNVVDIYGNELLYEEGNEWLETYYTDNYNNTYFFSTSDIYKKQTVIGNEYIVKKVGECEEYIIDAAPCGRDSYIAITYDYHDLYIGDYLNRDYPDYIYDLRDYDIYPISITQANAPGTYYILDMAGEVYEITIDAKYPHTYYISSLKLVYAFQTATTWNTPYPNINWQSDLYYDGTWLYCTTTHVRDDNAWELMGYSLVTGEERDFGYFDMPRYGRAFAIDKLGEVQGGFCEHEWSYDKVTWSKVNGKITCLVEYVCDADDSHVIQLYLNVTQPTSGSGRFQKICLVYKATIDAESAPDGIARTFSYNPAIAPPTPLEKRLSK